MLQPGFEPVTPRALIPFVTSGHRAHHCAKTGVSVTNAICPYDDPHPRVHHIYALIYVHIYISQIYILHICDVTTQGTCHGYPKPLHSDSGKTQPEPADNHPYCTYSSVKAYYGLSLRAFEGCPSAGRLQYYTIQFYSKALVHAELT